MSQRVVSAREVTPVVGETLIHRYTFYSDLAHETPADPTVVRWRVQHPSDAGEDAVFVYLTDTEVTKVSTGVYEFRHAATEKGAVQYRVEGTGAITAAAEYRIQHRASAFDATPGGA